MLRPLEHGFPAVQCCSAAQPSPTQRGKQPAPRTAPWCGLELGWFAGSCCRLRNLCSAAVPRRLVQQRGEAWSRLLRDRREIPGSQLHAHLAAVRLCGFMCQQRSLSRGQKALLPLAAKGPGRSKVWAQTKRTKDQKKKGARCQVPAGIAAKGREGGNCAGIHFDGNCCQAQRAGHGTACVAGLHGSRLLPRE